MTETNSKSFILTVKKSKTFQLVTSGFSKTTQWFIIIKNLFIKITLLISLEVRGETSVSLDILRMVIGTLFLSTKVLSSVAVAVTIAAAAKLTYLVESSMSNLVSIDYIFKQRTRVLSTVGLVHTMVADALKVTLNLLSDYDAGALSVIDGETLGDLDYTIIV